MMKSKLRVIVIEDHPLERQALVETLSDPALFLDCEDIECCEVKEAGDGAKAAELLAAAVQTHRPYDVALLDIALPRDAVDIREDAEVGMQLLEQLGPPHGKYHEGCDSVVIRSIKDDESDFQRYLRAGAADFLPKPSDTELAVPFVIQAFRKAQAKQKLAWLDKQAEWDRWYRLSAEASLADEMSVIVSDGVGEVLQAARLAAQELRDRFQIDVELDSSEPICRAIADVRKAATQMARRCAATRNSLATEDGAHEDDAAKSVDLQQLLDDVLVDLRPALVWRRVSVERVPVAAPCLVRSLPGRLRAVLTAVLSAAVEASATGETIRVAVKEDGPMWEILVQDKGPMIPPEIVEQINGGVTARQSDTRAWKLSLTQHTARNLACRFSFRNCESGGNETILSIPSAQS